MLSDEKNLIEKRKIREYVCSLFPEHIKCACKSFFSAYNGISEVRLRINSPISFTFYEQNLITSIKCTADDIAYCIEKMTESNLALYEEMMKQGFITLKYGCRAGISGDVFIKNCKIDAIRSILSLNIRFPSTIFTDVSGLLDYLESNAHSHSVLVVSPPGIGKTTVLKSVALKLASPPYSRRVAVIDTRRELYFEGTSSLCDFFTGYPKAEGIRIALTFFNPQYMICDEIGDEAEAKEIASLRHVGVPLIASAHAESFNDVRLRKNLNLMLENGVFDAIMRLYRSGETVKSEIFPVKDKLS